MSFKKYICFFTFSLFVSAMADPIPSQSEPKYEAEFYSKFEELISSHQEAYDFLVYLIPKAWVGFAKKLSVAEKLANSGKVDEATKVMKSVHLFPEFGLDLKQLYDFLVVFFNNYDKNKQ
ncbi:hypothetical protein Anas_06260 [Armadillidium nasatum]|uniref:Uncharacterized protein n=1 Tax=Armadillidium nasatum TaxID=96803 RepID=A0A5N5TF98_9CRUS|nr:hypothetical protein Anas_06260 [Armadillidium nasatum]